MNNTLRKIDLYILSLAILFIFFIIITFEMPETAFSWSDVIFWKELACSNVVSLISIGLLLYSLFAYKRFDFQLRGAAEIPFEIKKIESINYEHLTFLATYVVPLISFDFSIIRQVIVLFMLLVIMGIIYIKTDLFYANPSLALLGFRIYRADGNFKTGEQEGIILVSKGKLTVGEKVSYIKLDDRIYYARKNS